MMMNLKIRNDNPDKGTETKSLMGMNWTADILIRNDNPDKGTETIEAIHNGFINLRLEMITPIRGRKPTYPAVRICSSFQIRNDNPDKGTETVLPLFSRSPRGLMIRNDNPDKGTETLEA